MRIDETLDVTSDPAEDPRQHVFAWWRTLPAPAFSRAADVLLERLLAVTLPEDDGEQRLIAAVQEAQGFDKGDYAWAIALAAGTLAASDSDIVASWIALAAGSDSVPAIIALLQRLADRAETAARRVFLSWLRFAALTLPDMWSQAGRESWIRQLGDPVAHLRRPDAPASEPAPAADTPCLTVLQGEGDASRSAFDDFAATRQALSRPVPLFGDIDADEIEERLAREFPWLGEAVVRIGDDVALARTLGCRWFRMRPLLLVGAPGVGKTRFARRLAKIAGVPFGIVNAGGASDNRSLQGTSSGYSSAQPSAVLMLMANTGCANPLVLVDEIDKSSPSRRNGSIQDTLLGFLEGETSRRWFDECLRADADLSQVNWLLTANSLATIQAPLLSRLAVVPVPPPEPDAFAAVLAGILIDIAQEHGVDRRLLPMLELEVIDALRRSFRRSRNVRSIKAAVLRALAKAARNTSLQPN